MVAVIAGARQESRPVIFPVANRPDFLWLSASLQWLREACREEGRAGPHHSRAGLFAPKRTSCTGPSLFLADRGSWPQTMFLKRFVRVCKWQARV